MADGYGGYVSGHWRTHCAAWVIRETDTTATIRVESRIQTNRYGYTVSNGNKAYTACDGQNSGWQTAGTVNIPYGATAEQTMRSQDFTVNKTASGRNVWCSAGFQLGAVNKGTSEAGCNVAIGGIRYKAPNAPSNLSVSRNGDSGAKLTWTNHPDSNALKPYSQVIVDRRGATGGAAMGAWAMVAGLSGGASNYAATGLNANGRYQFRILARNTAGDSVHVESSTIHTTPAAPKSVTAVKNANGSVTVTADVSNSYPSWVTLWRKAGDGDWTQLRDQDNPMSLSGGKATYTDAAAPAGDAQYKCYVRRVVIGDAKTTDLSKTLVSAETVSNTVTTASAPNAPGIISPLGVIRYGTDSMISWEPNHPDGSKQSAAQIEITDPSGKVTVYTTEKDTSYTYRFDELGEYRIRVRTKGIHADWGKWSGYAQPRVAAPPNVVLTMPDTISGMPFDLSWSIADPTGVARQTVQITSLRSGRAVWSVPTGERSLSVTSNLIRPRNGDQVTVTLTVVGGSTLSASVTRTADVRYTPPAKPGADVSYTSDYQAVVAVSFNRTDPDDPIDQPYWTRWAGYPDDSASMLADFYTVWLGEANNSGSMLVTLDEGRWHPETVTAAVYRVDPDGTQTLVMDGLTDGQQAVDRLPPLNVDYTYRVVAYAESGASASTDAPARLRSNVNVLNFGADASEVLPMGLGQSVTRKAEHDTTEFDFADGSPYQTSYESGLVSSAVSTSDQRAYDQDEYQRIRRLAETYAFAWFRDAAGITEYVKVALQVGYDVTAAPRTITCTADMTRQAWKEPA